VRGLRGLSIILGVSLGLCGCAAGPDYSPFSIAVPISFVVSKAEKPAGRWAEADLAQWWRAFHDIELNSLVARAVVANPDVEIALDRLQQARTRVLEATAAALPSGDISGTKSWGTGSDVTRSRVSPEVHAAANTSGYTQLQEAGGLGGAWDLDFFGKHRREIEASFDDAEAAADDREGVLITVVSDVARAYLDLRGFQARLAVARQAIDAAQRNLDLVQNRAKQGITNDLDVTLAQRELASLQATVPTIQSDVSTAEDLIAVLLGRYPEDIVAELSRPRPIPAFPPRIAVGTPSELLRRRPDIQEAERNVAAATARIGVATADLYPDISVSGALGGQGGPRSTSGTPLTFIWAAGPTLYWPLLDFGTLDAKVDIADLHTKELIALYKKTVLQAVGQVDQSVVSFRAQQQRLNDLNRAIAAAKQAVSLSSTRYENGLTDFLNVLDAERQLYDLQGEYVQTQRAAAEQLVGLYKALGGGWQAYQTVPPIRQPEPALAASFERASAPRNVHDYLRTEQPPTPK
jgi:NodT family efflux transporter outer membrane factor (OMF) lipoprotein